MRHALILGLLSSLLPSAALGQDGAAEAAATPDVEAASDDRTERARELFRAGRQAYDQGRFREALDRFQRAYEIAPRGELLYNVAVAHDRLGDGADAIAAYGAYLEALPAAQNRAFVESRIGVLREEAEGRGGAEQTTTAQTPNTGSAAGVDRVAPHDGGAPVAAIVVLSVAGAAFVTGTITGVLALGQRSDLEDACPDLRCSPDRQGDIDSLRTMAAVTDVAFAVGAAAAVTGVLMLLLEGEEDPEAASLRCGPAGCLASIPLR